MFKKKEIAIHDGGFSGKYEIAIFSEQDGKPTVSVPVTMKDQSEGEMVDPLDSFTKDEIQEFFNRLWSMGFRPKDGTGNSGHIEALKYHLEDMRELALNRQEKKIEPFQYKVLKDE